MSHLSPPDELHPAPPGSTLSDTRAEQRLAAFARLADRVGCELDAELRVCGVIGALEASGGHPAAHLIGLTLWEAGGVADPDSDPTWHDVLHHLRNRRPFRDLPYVTRGVAGTQLHRVISGEPVLDSQGAFAGFRCVIRDGRPEADARQRAAALRDLLAETIEAMSDSVSIYGPDGRMVMRNRRHAEMGNYPAGTNPIGMSFEEVLRMNIARGYYPGIAGQEEAFIQERLAQQRQHGSATTFRNAFGRTMLAREYLLPEGYVLSLRTDVTEKVSQREELRLLNRALEATNQGILIVDANAPDLPVVYTNPAFSAITLYPPDEVLGKNCRFLQGEKTDQHAIGALREAIAERRPFLGEIVNHRRDGTVFINRLAVAPIAGDDGRVTHFVGVLSDMTEQRQMEAKLAHAAKLDAIGQLTTGIAHDFNNLLTVVSGNLDLTADRIGGQDHKADEFLHAAAAAAERGSELTRRLLAASRRHAAAVESVDLNEMLRDMAPMLARTLGGKVRTTLDLDGDACKVLVDRGQMESAILNLAINARDAISQRGTLRLATANVDVAAGMVPDLAPGAYVMVVVADTGSGMDAAVLARVLEPFFTTKTEGQGTGLGLSIVHGLLRQSGGQMTIESRKGRGTTVRLYLPCPAAQTKAGCPCCPATALAA